MDQTSITSRDPGLGRNQTSQAAGTGLAGEPPTTTRDAFRGCAAPLRRIENRWEYTDILEFEPERSCDIGELTTTWPG